MCLPAMNMFVDSVGSGTFYRKSFSLDPGCSASLQLDLGAGVLQIILLVISMIQLNFQVPPFQAIPANCKSQVVVLGASIGMKFTIEVEFVPELDILR